MEPGHTSGSGSFIHGTVVAILKRGCFFLFYDALQVPGVLALAAAAWHHRSDALSSIGALIGIGGARLGFPVMDSIASLIIFLFIVKAALDIFKDTMDKMVDHSCDEEMEKQLYDRVMKNEKVIGVDLLQTRIFGNRIYVDVEIRADAAYTLQEAHSIAEAVHDEIEREFQKVKHIMVHVNPGAKDQ